MNKDISLTIWLTFTPVVWPFFAAAETRGRKVSKGENKQQPWKTKADAASLSRTSGSLQHVALYSNMRSCVLHQSSFVSPLWCASDVFFIAYIFMLFAGFGESKGGEGWDPGAHRYIFERPWQKTRKTQWATLPGWLHCLFADGWWFPEKRESEWGPDGQRGADEGVCCSACSPRQVHWYASAHSSLHMWGTTWALPNPVPVAKTVGSPGTQTLQHTQGVSQNSLCQDSVSTSH